MSCANQGSPKGGPRDTIPPVLIKSIPENKSVNHTSKVFEFEFDERINADKLISKLNITPRIENKFKPFTKKNKLVLTFEDSFLDSTTYTLNFADGVGDLTENNPVENFSFAFSTGPTIDSIYINGHVTNLYNNKVQKDILIALYDISDTLNLFTGKPKYFTKTDEAGVYNIENIKNGNYKLYAFLDDNNNLTNNPKEEPHGFIQDTLNLNTSIDSLFLQVQLIDASQPLFVRAKHTGQYYDILYNKYCSRYTVSKLNSDDKLNIPAHNLFKEQTMIRFYKHESFQYDTDSLELLVNFYDSLDNQLQDTVFVNFKVSKRKSSPFEMSVLPVKKSIKENLNLSLEFSKPIKKFNTDSIFIKYDTIQAIPLFDSLILWNHNKTKLSIKLQLDKDLIPNFLEKLKIETAIKDSLNALIKADTTIIKEAPSTQKIPQEEITEKNSKDPRSGERRAPKHSIKNQINIILKQAAFISVDNDSTKSKNEKYTFSQAKELGKLKGKVSTTSKNYILQLTDLQYNVISQLNNPVNFQFNDVEPGKYTFRVLIDSNNNGVWSPGNILKDKQAEPIWFFSEIFDLRANWEVDNLDISF